MAILLCDGKEFSVKKFVKESRMYTLDMSFESKKEFEEFSKLYERYEFSEGVFDFEIEGEIFKGWFGNMLYDKKYNVRVIIGIYDGIDELESGCKVYNVQSSLIGIGNAIRKICDVLEKNNNINNEQKNDILKTMNTPETDIEFQHLVEDLPLYLETSKQTIEDIKKELDL